MVREIVSLYFKVVFKREVMTKKRKLFDELMDGVSSMEQQRTGKIILREALRLKMQQDEIYQTRLKSLRAAIIQGEESGDAVPFNMQDIIQDAKKDAGLNA